MSAWDSSRGRPIVREVASGSIAQLLIVLAGFCHIGVAVTPCMGSRLVDELIRRGQTVSGLVRAGAERLGLVTLQQMISALVASVESPADGI